MSKLHNIISRKQKCVPPALPAAVITAAATAAVLTVFTYRSNAPEAKQQYTVLSHIHREDNEEFFYQLELRDPEKMLGGNGGSFTALQKKRVITLKTRIVSPVFTPENTVSDGKFQSLPELPGTASVKFHEPQKPSSGALRRGTKIIAPNGSVLTVPALEAIKVSDRPAGATVVRLSGTMAMRHGRVLNSCGNAELDAQAVEILRKQPDLTGVYSVIWSKNPAGEKI